MSRSYFTLFACDKDGFWVLGKFLYADDLDHALEDATKYQAGEPSYKMVNPSAIITVVEWIPG